MPTQIGQTRVYTTIDEKDKPSLTSCPVCEVKAVPRGITSTKYTAKGEEHCPNCGHVYGRNSLVTEKANLKD